MNCTQEPISRLKLELYHLGELPAEKRGEIQHHIDTCGACKAALDYIANDDRVMPPLRIPAPSRQMSFFDTIIRQHLFVWTATAAIAVVALFFMILPEDNHSFETEQDTLANVKGGDAAIYIVRNRDGVVDENPAAFQEGDRFKIFVTYLGNNPAKWDLAVFQGDKVYFPLTPTNTLPAGARTPLQGALSLDGSEPASICIFVGNNKPDRARLAEEKHNSMSAAAACKTLRPVDFD